MTKSFIPERESRFLGLSYSHAAKVLVARFERREDARSVESLYLRHASADEYERLAPPDDTTSYKTPVVVRNAPTLFFNVWTISERGGGDWLHVARANLVTREVEVVLRPPDLQALTLVEPQWRMLPWVSELHSASDDGSTLTFRLGVPQPLRDGSIRIQYSIFDFDVRERRLTRLADLASSFC